MNRTRLAIALALGIATAIFVCPAAWSLTHSGTSAIPIAVLAAALATFGALRSPQLRAVPATPPKALAITATLVTLAALVVFARLAVFMVAPSQVGYSSMPMSKFEVAHSCVTAYYVAGRAASGSHDIYADSLYTARDDDPTKIRKPLMMGPFRIDVFEYPPPFLLLPRLLLPVTPDFMSFRMLWFGLNGLFVLLAMILTARLLAPAAGARALLFMPLAWFALPTLSVMQKGNVQAMVIAAAMLAMVLFERRRFAAGGALLAFAAVSKLYPGLLIVYLAARREWRALAWTAGFGVVFAVATAIDLGPAVYQVFLRHLPGLLGGEAFPAFRNPNAIAINYSIPGLVFKLKLFGIAGASFTASKLLGWIYTVVAVAATIALARRAQHDDEKPLAWLAVLILATLRSPFLPGGYAAFPALWLLTLIAARYEPTPRVLAYTLLSWVFLAMMFPPDTPLDPRWLALVSGVPQLAMILITVLVVQGRFSARAPAPMAALGAPPPVPAVERGRIR